MYFFNKIYLEFVLPKVLTQLQKMDFFEFKNCSKSPPKRKQIKNKIRQKVF